MALSRSRDWILGLSPYAMLAFADMALSRSREWILGSSSYAIFANADIALSHPRECDSREFDLCHIMEDVDYVVVILQALDKGVDVLLLLG